MAFTWSEVTPGTASSTKAIRDIVFCDATHVVAVGDTGLVYISSDAGASFSAVTPPEANSWRGCAYAPASSGLGSGSGRLVAVSSGGSNRVMYSDDFGATWNTASATSASGWQSVDWDTGHSKFVAVASSSGVGVDRVMVSTDGITWVSHAASAAKTWSFVRSNGSVIVAAHVSGGTDCVMTSTDGGTTWASQTTPNWSTVGGPSSGNSGIAWMSSLGLWAMSVRRSSDSKFRIATASSSAATWTERSIVDDVNRPGDIIACPAAGLFVFFDQAGTNRYNYSSDGATWADGDEGIRKTWDCGQWGEAAQVVLAWNQSTNGTFLRGVWVGPLAISPATGFTSGGQTFTITGGSGGFASGTIVEFGRYYGGFVRATNINVVSGTRLTGTLPAFPIAEVVSVQITNPSAAPVGITDGFTYVTPSTAAGGSGSFSLSPNHGPTTGGTVVTITAVGGYVFGASPRVAFDGVLATGVSGGGTSTLTCTAPAHVAKAVDVVVYDS